jgi:hypothetical protein
MSILNVNQIQPVGGGNTITVSASDVNFSGNISVGSNFIGIVTASTATVATNAQGLTGTPDITVNNIQSGVVTATTFIGDGSGLTGVTASGSGINIKDSGTTVGVAATVDFGTNLNVSPASVGIVTVTVGDTDFEIVDKIVHTGDTDTAIRFPAADTITAETGGSERLRITSDGKIGIGTDNPIDELHINNNSANVNLRLTRGNNGARITGSDGVSPAIIFETIASDVGTERLRIYSDGHGKFNNGAITRVLVVDDDTPSGTSQTYTSIPSWATKITILFDQVSTTGGSELLVQLGTSGGAITSNYDSSSSNSSGGTLETSTAGFVLYVSSGGSSELVGKMEIQRAGTSKKWISSHVMKNSGNTRDGAGVLTTYSGTIDRVVVTTEGGSNTFDGGAITVYAEA